ncbi:MAG: hypothetical protein ACPIOQ_36085 [Promethearchaeia archaeon]
MEVDATIGPSLRDDLMSNVAQNLYTCGARAFSCKPALVCVCVCARARLFEASESTWAPLMPILQRPGAAEELSG